MELDGMMAAENWGVDFFGVADLTPIRDAVVRQGGTALGEYPRAVSLGIALLHAVIDQLPRRAERAVALGYRHHLYNVTDRRLDLAAGQLSSLLQREGYRALPIAASEQVNDVHICAVFSHKLAAHLAGLGWIGKSCLLVTPAVGPRVRWATVLTDAPLAAAAQLMESRCGGCVECVEICPVRSLAGRAFREDEPREVRFDAERCDRYIDELKEERGPEAAVCGLCLYVCPYGRRTRDRMVAS
jgi:epoxyqueuosine reductase